MTYVAGMSNHNPKVWFTGDTHYGHKAVIEYCKRPFVDDAEAAYAMIDRWNAVVKPGDRVYHLGDFALCKPDLAIAIAKRLNGQKYLIFGNHDKALRKNKDFLDQWIWARDFEQIEVEGQKISLMHYAMRVWPSSHHGAWQLYGHSHGSLQDDSRLLQLDVGVDCWDYAPVSFETIRERMSLRKWEPVDHHRQYNDGKTKTVRNGDNVAGEIP